jgi:hypothetical protein
LEAERIKPHDDTILYNIACCYCRLHNRNKAIEYLNKAFENEFYKWAHAYYDDDLKEIQNDKEFIDILKKMLPYSSGICFGDNITKEEADKAKEIIQSIL